MLLVKHHAIRSPGPALLPVDVMVPSSFDITTFYKDAITRSFFRLSCPPGLGAV